MFSIYTSKPTAGGALITGFALADDTLPVEGIANGSTVTVLDDTYGTVSTYRYNATGGAWVETPEDTSSQVPAIGDGDTGKFLKAGSSGPEWAEAGGGSGVLIVHMDIDAETSTATLDKTWQEIHDAGFSVLVDEDGDYADAGDVMPVISIKNNGRDCYVVFAHVDNGDGSVDVLGFTGADPDDYPIHVFE